MMNLNSRELLFLRYLLEETKYKPVSYFAGKMNVTVRTLRNDLKNIEYFLNSLGVKLERRRGLGICLGENDREKLSLHISLSAKRKDGLYVKPTERRLEILRMLLYGTEEILSVQKLSDIFFVSHSSIVNDLKTVEKWLNDHGLDLIRDTAGTRVRGNEIQIRKGIFSYIEEIEFDKRDEFQTAEFISIDNVAMENILKRFSEKNVYFLDKLLNEMEKQCTELLADQYYISLLTYLLIAMERISYGHQIKIISEKLPADYRNEYAFALAQKISRQMESQLMMKLEYEESVYIYEYLAAIGIAVYVNENGEYIGKNIQEEIIQWITKAMSADFSSDEALKNELGNHIDAMLNRHRYHIQIKNQLLSGMMQLYPEMMEYLGGVLWCLSEKYKFDKPSRDETAFLAMCCQVAVNAARRRQRVLVVCQSGYGTSRLLLARLIQAFPNLELEGTISVKELRTIELAKYSFIISTVRLRALPIPYIILSPLLLEQDIEKVKISGLLNENVESDDGIDTLTWLLSREYIEIVKDSKQWERNVKQLEQVEVQDKYQVYGGKLDVILVRDAQIKKIIIFKERECYTYKAIIAGTDIETVLELFSSYYKVVMTENSRCRLNDFYVRTDFLYHVLPPWKIVTGKVFDSKEHVIKFLAQRLFDQDEILDVEAFCRDVFAREMEGSTVIEDNVALPHGQSHTMSLAMAILPFPILWRQYDGHTIYVQIVVLFGINPKDAYNRHSDYFRVLSMIGKATDSAEKRNLLLNAENEEHAFEILARTVREDEEDTEWLK